jgi:outer membrane protein insertion porin family
MLKELSNATFLWYNRTATIPKNPIRVQKTLKLMTLVFFLSCFHLSVFGQQKADTIIKSIDAD